MSIEFFRESFVEVISDRYSEFRARHGRSPLSYLATPPVIRVSWYCITELSYCGAPDGVRCECGAQLHGHDPGDEG